ncbi:MAG: hypothetical protein ACXU86_01120 [Archangium sp.]
MAKILIIKCSVDDDDGQMAQMANSIESFQKGLGHTVTVIDLSVLNPDRLTADFARLGVQDEVVFTGHSRFFEGGSRFMAPTRYVPRPLADRRVGGYTSEQIAPVVVAAALTGKARDVMFCCCEIASNVDTHEREDDGAKEILIDFPRNGLGLIRHYLTTPLGNAKVSLLFDIAAKVQALLRSMAYGGTVTLKGLNGVGYIVGDRPEYLSFSQEHFARYDTIRRRQARAKVMTRDDEFLEGYVLDKTKKKSAHVLGFTVKPG